MTQQHTITLTMQDTPKLREVLTRLHEEAEREQDQITWDMAYTDLATARNTITLHLQGVATNDDMTTAKDLITRAIDILHTLGTAPKELRR